MVSPADVFLSKVICAVLTSHNRREETLRSLSALSSAAERVRVPLQAVLVDDGSTDGTVAAVNAAFDWVHVEIGDGSYFWSRGTARGMEIAARMYPTALQLLLNDDTQLLPDAIEKLLETASMIKSRHGREGIVIGATCDPVSKSLTYGGILIPSSTRRFRFQKVYGADKAVSCDTLNGNVVLVSAVVIADIGIVDSGFEHAMGDIDYGLRASRRGHPLYVAPGFVGTCSNNPKTGTYEDGNLPLRTRMRLMLHRKGQPWRSWLRLTRRHGGLFWPVYFAYPYLRVAFSALRRRPEPA